MKTQMIQSEKDPTSASSKKKLKDKSDDNHDPSRIAQQLETSKKTQTKKTPTKKTPTKKTPTKKTPTKKTPTKSNAIKIKIEGVSEFDGKTDNSIQDSKLDKGASSRAKSAQVITHPNSSNSPNFSNKGESKAIKSDVQTNINEKKTKVKWIPGMPHGSALNPGSKNIPKVIY